MIGYELWDMQSGNLLEAFDGEADALAAVARTASRYGPTAVEAFALARVDDGSDEVERIAVGAELLARARQLGTDGGVARVQEGSAPPLPTR